MIVFFNLIQSRVLYSHDLRDRDSVPEPTQSIGAYGTVYFIPLRSYSNQTSILLLAFWGGGAEYWLQLVSINMRIGITGVVG